MKGIVIATALIVATVGCKAKNRDADTSGVTDTARPAVTDTARGAMAQPGGTTGTSGSAAGAAGGTVSGRTGGAAGTTGGTTRGGTSGTAGTAQNQTQSGVTNAKTGTSTLGPNVKKTSPTSTQPVTAKGDTLAKKPPR